MIAVRRFSFTAWLLVAVFGAGRGWAEEESPPAATESPAANEPPAKKLPVPDAEGQAAPRKLVKELYGETYAAAKTPEKKRALAQELLKRGSESGNDAAGKYVLLVAAKDIAVEAGDMLSAAQAIDALEAAYDVDALELKMAVLAAAAKGARLPDQRKAIAQEVLDLAEAAISKERFEEAKKLHDLAAAHARSARDPELAQRCKRLLAGLHALRKEAEQIAAVRQKLAENPDDPAACLAMGRYLCLQKRDWGAGLPYLARCGDEGLKAAAAAELQPPQEPQEQAKLADRWWALAEGAEGVVQDRLRARGAHWYREAFPGLSGLAKEKARMRMDSVAAESPVTTAGEPKGAAVRRLRFTSPAALRQFVTPRGQPSSWAVQQGRLVIGGSQSNAAVYGEHFQSIASVTIRGTIVPPAQRNFRVSVGPINMILSWEGADENHFRNSDAHSFFKTQPRAIVPGRFSTIQVKQQGANVVVLIDGKEHWAAPGTLQGTVAVYTMGGTVAVQEIVIEGKVDAERKVTGPSHENLM